MVKIRAAHPVCPHIGVPPRASASFIAHTRCYIIFSLNLLKLVSSVGTVGTRSRYFVLRFLAVGFVYKYRSMNKEAGNRLIVLPCSCRTNARDKILSVVDKAIIDMSVTHLSQAQTLFVESRLSQFISDVRGLAHIKHVNFVQVS